MSFCLRVKNWLRFVILKPDKIASVNVSRSIYLGRCRRMRLRPQVGGNDQGIDCLFLPPGVLVAAPVKLPVMQPADRDGEAVADLAPHRPLLRELDVVGIRRGAAA